MSRVQEDFTAILPIANADLNAIEAMLRKADMFRWAYAALGADVFSARPYIEQKARYGNVFFLLLDRNILGRIVALYGDHPSGSPLPEEARVAAAIVAFATVTGIGLDPWSALLEAPFSGIETRQNESYRLRLLWNMHPQKFVDIALGRRGHVTPNEVEEVRANVEVPSRFDNVRPSNWDKDYVAALKMAEILLEAWPARPGVAGMETLLQWMYRDYAFTSPAIAYASLGLGRRPRKGMFKGLHSGDAEAVFAGVRNAAWDMSLLRVWSQRTRHAHSRGEFYVLCSGDDAVLTCAAGFTVLSGAGPSAAEALRARIERDWTSKDAKRLLATYERLSASLSSDKTRAIHVGEPRSDPHKWTTLTRSLEDQVRLLTIRDKRSH